MIWPFGDCFCRPGLAGNPPADPFKTAASTSALTLASGAPWVQSSTVSASGQRVWSMRRLRSSRSACGTARVKGVMASFMDLFSVSLHSFRSGCRCSGCDVRPREQPPQHWPEVRRLIERMSAEDLRAFYVQCVDGLVHLRCGVPHLADSFAREQEVPG